MARSKSRSRASVSKKSSSPAKKSPSPSKTPSRTTKPRSVSRSRGRPAKKEVQTTPKRAASKTRVASRSSSRSRTPKTPAVKSVATPKKSPLSATPSSSTSPVRSTARTFERADDDVPVRSLRSLTQSRERAEAVQKPDTPKRASCAIAGNLCQKLSDISKSVKTHAQNSNRFMKRRFGAWYGETIALIIIIALLSLVVTKILHYDPAKLRIFITHNFNKAVAKTTTTFNHVKDVIKKKIQ